MQRTIALLMTSALLWQIFAMGMPVSDLDANGQVDLQDAIIAARGIARLAECEKLHSTGGTNLVNRVRDAVDVLRSMSGTIPRMSADSDGGPSNPAVYFALHRSSGFTPPCFYRFCSLTGTSNFKSTAAKPIVPPPESLRAG